MLPAFSFGPEFRVEDRSGIGHECRAPNGGFGHHGGGPDLRSGPSSYVWTSLPQIDWHGTSHGDIRDVGKQSKDSESERKTKWNRLGHRYYGTSCLRIFPVI